MPVEKIAVSLAPELATAMREAAEREGSPSLSAWLADAARLKLRRTAMAGVLADYEREHGEITAEEMAATRAEWPG